MQLTFQESQVFQMSDYMLNLQLATDAVFGSNWDRQIKEHQALADTFAFVFGYRSDNETMIDWMGIQKHIALPTPIISLE